MPQEFVTTGRVEGGKLKIRNRQQLEAELSRWKDGELLITIERAHATRSLAANAYYWAVIVHILSEHTGYSPDDMHAILKAKFLPKKLAVMDGNGVIVDELVIGGTTTTLNKIQFGDYLEAIRVWAATELGMEFPSPREYEGAA